MPPRDDVFIESFALFRDHLVLQERCGGLARLQVRPWSGDGAHDVAFDEPVYDVRLSVNREPDTRMLRFGYESLTTPRSIYDYDMEGRSRTLLKRGEVLGGFDPADYEAERVLATAPDGRRVPISLVERTGAPRDGTSPLLLYGYGAYGISMDPAFSSARLSLLDRGFRFAIAHVRGGQELGGSGTKRAGGAASGTRSPISSPAPSTSSAGGTRAPSASTPWAAAPAGC